MTPWGIRAMELARTNRGWRCEVAFRVRTRRQSTMEDHVVYDGADGHGPLSVLLACWRGLRARHREVLRLQSLDGPWSLTDPGGLGESR